MEDTITQLTRFFVYELRSIVRFLNIDPLNTGLRVFDFVGDTGSTSIPRLYQTMLIEPAIAKGDLTVKTFQSIEALSLAHTKHKTAILNYESFKTRMWALFDVDYTKCTFREPYDWQDQVLEVDLKITLNALAKAFTEYSQNLPDKWLVQWQPLYKPLLPFIDKIYIKTVQSYNAEDFRQPNQRGFNY